MPIVRLIFCSFPADQSEKAVRNWKEGCAPLMIRQAGCLSERLLRRSDGEGEFISYSEWEDEDSIKAYLRSEAHQEIKRRNRNIEGAEVVVKHYELVR